MGKIISITALLLVVGSPSVRATPATLHIGSGYGTACETGGCPLYKGEVNNFDVGLDIYQTSGGASALVDPVLLILGVPNTTSSNQLTASALDQAFVVDATTGTKTSISFTFGTNSYGLSGNGYEGLMTSGHEVYSFLGLTANNSNSFKNWSQWDLAIDGIAASNFGIYVFAFGPGNAPLANFAGKDFIDVLTNGIPEGTFAVAYGQDSAGKAYATPFTEAGLVDVPPPSVPEPMTLALMSIGIAGLALSRRRKIA